MSVELYQLHSMHSIVSLYSTRNNRSANVVNQIFLGTEYARQNWIEKTNESAMHADGSHGHNPICVVTMSTGIWQFFILFFQTTVRTYVRSSEFKKVVITTAEIENNDLY